MEHPSDELVKVIKKRASLTCTQKLIWLFTIIVLIWVLIINLYSNPIQMTFIAKLSEDHSSASPCCNLINSTDYIKGEWIYHPTNLGDKYKWIPKYCNLKDINTNMFTEKLSSLDIDNILIVGDSLSCQTAQCFNRIVSNKALTDLQLIWTKTGWNNFTFNMSSIVVRFIRNDHLTINNISNIYQPNKYSRVWNKYVTNQTFIILNTGAHLADFYNYKDIWNETRLFLPFLDLTRYFETINFGGYIIYRTSPMPHKGCTNVSKPLTHYEFAQVNQTSPYYNYHWEKLIMFNKMGKNMIQILKEHGFNAFLFDVEPVISLRQDMHGRPPTDCLHYLYGGLSSPVDTIIKLLYNFVLAL
eukprot:219309_1